jgi:hypothetical protein
VLAESAICPLPQRLGPLFLGVPEWLQKLVLVLEQNLRRQSHFFAVNYGRFKEEVNDPPRVAPGPGFFDAACRWRKARVFIWIVPRHSSFVGRRCPNCREEFRSGG